MELRFWKKNNFFFFFKILKCIRTYRESKYAVMEPFSIFFVLSSENHFPDSDPMTYLLKSCSLAWRVKKTKPNKTKQGRRPKQLTDFCCYFISC